MSKSKPANTDDDGINRPVDRSVILPQNLLTLFTEKEWEEFTAEWAEGFEEKYSSIENRAGAGDKGRDVVCYAGEDKGSCDIDVYQCKRYEHPIRPSEFWVELGKLCVYTQSGELRIPRRYRLVASRGVGGTLADLFENPERLRTELI